MNEPIIHVWVTKYALSSGVIETDAKHCTDISDKMIVVQPRPGVLAYRARFFKPHWHTSKDEANAQVHKMILAKIKSLKKSVAKMEELLTQYPEGAKP